MHGIRPRSDAAHAGCITAGTQGRARRGLPVAALLVAAVCGVLPGCGYTLAGQGSFLPDYIETVAIPTFGNNTSIFDVEQLLTQEVRTAFISRGSYRVQTDEAGADATLTGTITAVRIAPASFSADQQASRYVFTLQAAIEFRDLTTDEVIWDDGQMVFSDEYEVASGTGDIASVSTFFGQQANTVERLAVDFATTVVSSILEAF
jgi:hypothetical protein